MVFSMKHRALRTIGHQHWLRGRDRILRLLSHPDRQAPDAFEVDFFGLPYSGHLTNFVDWTVFYYGAFARNELLLLAEIAGKLRAAGKPVNFFDVGANVGHHSLFMSSHADHVFAFEPFPMVRAEMARKLRHANAGNATIFAVALGDRNETGAFHTPIDANQGTGTLSDFLPGNASAETIPVDVVRGDDFFLANRLPPVSLLKMDVEGYEAKALDGLRETIRRDRPPVLTEIHGPTRSGFETAERLKELLYPDHLLFDVGARRGNFVLRPFSFERTGEALVLPAELADFANVSR
jgi:FkbM family methyltransferase